MGTTTVYLIGTGTGNWTVPAGVTTVTVECWGAGGGSASTADGGGGGGAYASASESVTAGTVVAFSIGAGGTTAGTAGGATFWVASGTLNANGGSGSTTSSAGAGGTAGATGTTHFAGGSGATHAQGGGGGGAGGPDGAGVSSTTTTGGAGDNSNAAGGGGGASNTAGSDGSAGGGGGGGGTGGAGGFPGGGGGNAKAGANGQIRLTYTTTPTQTIYLYYNTSTAAVVSGTFICPTGVTTVTAQCWGGGGGGNASSGASGGGGAFASGDVSVTAGNSYSYQIGNGGAAAATGGTTWFSTSTTVAAVGGNTSDAGGSSGSCFGTTKSSGGNGATGSTKLGGGGSAGPDGIGGNNVSGTGGAGDNSSGGAGGANSGTGGNAGTSNSLGGGGGGGASTASAGAGGSPGGGGGNASTGGAGKGGYGQLILTMTIVTTAALTATIRSSLVSPVAHFSASIITNYGIAPAGATVFWISPSGVSNVMVECWGGGGGGFTGASGGGGGGAGAYSRGFPIIKPFNQYYLNIGGGGAASANGNSSYFGDNNGVNWVIANGGNAGTVGAGGAGGAAGSSPGSFVSYDGGDGTSGGGGGGAAGPDGPGLNGSTTTGGSADNGFGGGDGGTTGNAGSIDFDFGGGGGGGSTVAVGKAGGFPGGGGGGGTTGGAGADGLIKISYASGTYQYIFIIGTNATTSPTSTWTCPSYCYSLTVKCWGGGGSGFATAADGGGGGGAYSSSVLSVTPGTAYNYQIGAMPVSGAGGTTWFSTSSTVAAVGGGVGLVGAGGAGGLSSSGFGNSKFSGGAGAMGGGGGGAAGPDGAGGAASTSAGGTGDNGNVAAGNSSTYLGGGGVPNAGGFTSNPGGGGGAGAGGGGGYGQITLTYSPTATLSVKAESITTLKDSFGPIFYISTKTISRTSVKPNVIFSSFMSGIVLSSINERLSSYIGKTSIYGVVGSISHLLASGYFKLPIYARIAAIGNSNSTIKNFMALLSKTFSISNTTVNPRFVTSLSTIVRSLESAKSSASYKTNLSANTIAINKSNNVLKTLTALLSKILFISTTTVNPKFVTPLLTIVRSIENAKNTVVGRTTISANTAGINNGNNILRTLTALLGKTSSKSTTAINPGYVILLSTIVRSLENARNTIAGRTTIGANAQFSTTSRWPLSNITISSTYAFLKTFLSASSSGKTPLSGHQSSIASVMNFGKFSMPLPAVRAFSNTIVRSTLVAASIPVFIYANVISILTNTNIPMGNTQLAANTQGVNSSQNTPLIKMPISAITFVRTIGNNTIKTGYILIGRVLSTISGTNTPTGKTPLLATTKGVGSSHNLPLFSGLLSAATITNVLGKNSITTGYILVGKVLSTFTGKNVMAGRTSLLATTQSTNSILNILLSSIHINARVLSLSNIHNQLITGYNLLGRSIFSSKLNSGLFANTQLHVNLRSSTTINNTLLTKFLINTTKIFTKFSGLGLSSRRVVLSSRTSTATNFGGVIYGNIVFVTGIIKSVFVAKSSVRFGNFREIHALLSALLFSGKSAPRYRANLRSNVLTLTKTKTNTDFKIHFRAISKVKTSGMNHIRSLANIFGKTYTTTFSSSIGIRQFLGAISLFKSTVNSVFNLGFTNPNYIDYKSSWTSPWKMVVSGPEMLLSPKDPSETVIVTFDFASVLASGEILESIVGVTSSLFYGSDTNPSAMVVISPVILNTTQMVQSVSGGLDQNTYKIKATVNTNLNQILTSTAILPVVAQ